MTIILCWSALGLGVGFFAGKVYFRIYRRKIRKLFRRAPKSNSAYSMSRTGALTYVMELEKQEIEIRQAALKQMTTITVAALAVSGGLALKHMIAFHWFAIMMYVVALVSGYVGTCVLADYRKKRSSDVLKSLRLSVAGQVSLTRKNANTPFFVRLSMFSMYLFFLIGIFFTTNSFFAKKYCENLVIVEMNAGDRFMCDLVFTSEYVAEQLKIQQK